MAARGVLGTKKMPAHLLNKLGFHRRTMFPEDGIDDLEIRSFRRKFSGYLVDTQNETRAGSEQGKLFAVREMAAN